MFDDVAAVTAEGLEALFPVLSRVGAGGDSDQERVDQLAVLERVKSAVAAAQVRVTAAFVDSQQRVAQAWRERARECSDAGDFDGWRAARAQALAASFDDDGTGHSGRQPAAPRRSRRPSGMTGVAAQVALAGHESPVRGAAHVRLALTLTRDMPHTLAALEAGELSEWRAQLVVNETASLTSEHRSLVDAEVVGPLSDTGGTAGRVESLGDRELARRVRAIAYRVDAASVMARAVRAESERRVTIRPAPDTMANVTALLPVAQAVAAHAALTAAADTSRAAGDERGKGQVMADTFVTRITGQAAAGAVPVEVQFVMTDRALLAGDATPAQLAGYGTVPAACALPARRIRSRPGPRLGRGAGLAAAALLAPRHGDPRRDGLHPPHLRRWAAPLPARPRRRHLPHPLVRRPRPARRPRPGPRPGRTHHRHQRPRRVRAVQPHQAAPRLHGRDTPHLPTRRTPRRTHHHTDRAHLHLSRPTPAPRSGPGSGLGRGGTVDRLDEAGAQRLTADGESALRGGILRRALSGLDPHGLVAPLTQAVRAVHMSRDRHVLCDIVIATPGETVSLGDADGMLVISTLRRMRAATSSSDLQRPQAVARPGHKVRQARPDLPRRRRPLRDHHLATRTGRHAPAPRFLSQCLRYTLKPDEPVSMWGSMSAGSRPSRPARCRKSVDGVPI